MNVKEAIGKAAKLLRLAESSNPHEAALAAQRAQELFERYEIDRAALVMDGTSLESEEEIEDFTHRAPLDSVSTIPRWKAHLASAVSRSNGCRIYMHHGIGIGLVGRPSDADKVRYLYAYLSREVERLVSRDGNGCGRTWRNNYRLGVVDTVAAKLKEANEATASAIRVEAAANPMVLARMEMAIAIVEARGQHVDVWMERNLRLRTRSEAGARSDYSGRAAGRQAGRAISISGARQSLPSGARALRGGAPIVDR